MFSDYKQYILQLDADLRQKGIDLGIEPNKLYKGGLTQYLVRLELFFALNDILRMANGDDEDLVYLPDNETTLFTYLEETIREEFVRERAEQEDSLFAQPEDAGIPPLEISVFDVESIESLLDLEDSYRFEKTTCEVVDLPEHFKPRFNFKYHEPTPTVELQDSIQTEAQSISDTTPSIDDFVEDIPKVEETPSIDDFVEDTSSIDEFVDEPTTTSEFTEELPTTVSFEEPPEVNPFSTDMPKQSWGEPTKPKRSQPQRQHKAPNPFAETELWGHEVKQTRPKPRAGQHRPLPSAEPPRQRPTSEKPRPNREDRSFQAKPTPPQKPKTPQKSGDALADGLVSGVNKIYGLFSGKGGKR